MIDPIKTRYHRTKINGRMKLLHRHIMEYHIGRPLLRTENEQYICTDDLLTLLATVSVESEGDYKTSISHNL